MSFVPPLGQCNAKCFKKSSSLIYLCLCALLNLSLSNYGTLCRMRLKKTYVLWFLNKREIMYQQKSSQLIKMVILY